MADIRLIFTSQADINQERLERLEILVAKTKTLAKTLSNPYFLNHPAVEANYRLAFLRKVLTALRYLQSKGPQVLNNYLKKKSVQEGNKSSQELVKAMGVRGMDALSWLIEHEVNHLKVQRLVGLLGLMRDYRPGPFVIVVELADTADILGKAARGDYRVANVFNLTAQKRAALIAQFKERNLDIIFVSAKLRNEISVSLKDAEFVLFVEKSRNWKISLHKAGAEGKSGISGVDQEPEQLPLFGSNLSVVLPQSEAKADPATPPDFQSGEGRTASQSNIKFDIPRRWKVTPGEYLPISIARKVIRELFIRNNGQFMVDTLAKILGDRIRQDRISGQVKIEYRQEAGLEGVFKVEFTSPDKEPVIFGLIVGKRDSDNSKVREDYETISYFYNVDPRYIVKPYMYDQGAFRYKDREGNLSMFTVAWMEGYDEVNFVLPAFGRARGLIALGQRTMGVVLNIRGKQLQSVGSIKIEEWIKREIVKIITLYFNPEKGEMLADINFNGGDFIVSLAKRHIVLCTSRGKHNFSSINIPGVTQRQVNIAYFIDYLMNVKTLSLGAVNIALVDFNIAESRIFSEDKVREGIRAALIEKLGEEEGLRQFKSW
ncbi:MAG: hypothetical protein Q7U96_02655, partial [Chloroflexota bacterium]|nr:hypothetical protein [Chloroflexota bacterium]